MREIKFRAWDTKRKLMLENVNVNGAKAVEQGYQWFNQPTSAAYLKLMQFTGAFDSYSVEMYADDICAAEGLGNCRVGICPFYGVTFYDKDDLECLLIDCISEDDIFKVIGNIHENPELLEGNE